MSFDFSDLVVQDDESEFYNYDNFLSDPIYDWLQEPDNVLNACNAIEEEQQKPKQKLVTIIQQPQTQNTAYYKRVAYKRGPYRKKQKKNSS
jgi:hypothetical protein